MISYLASPSVQPYVQTGERQLADSPVNPGGSLWLTVSEMVPQNPCLLVLRSCVTLTPWALLGPSDSLTQNRIQQTGWGVTPKVGLQKDWDFSLVCYLLLSVGAFSPEETSHHEWAALWSPRPGVDGFTQQPMRNWDPSVVIETAWNGSSPA